MKLYSWNVNGIRAIMNKGSLQDFIKNFNPDILCLQETKANRDQFDIDFLDYHEYFFSAVKKGYSGTAILSKEKPIKILEGFPSDIVKDFELDNDKYGNPNNEGRLMSAEFADFWLVNVYTPNSKGDLSRLKLRYEYWDKAFLTYIKSLEKTKPVLICGDLNVAYSEIDLANPKQNIGKNGFTSQERERFRDYLEAGFVDTFRKFYPDKTEAYSWWSYRTKARERNTGWRIDYWLVSKSISNKITSASIHSEIIGSDHCPVAIELEL